jgi:hypothetical protein
VIKAGPAGGGADVTRVAATTSRADVTRVAATTSARRSI